MAIDRLGEGVTDRLVVGRLGGVVREDVRVNGHGAAPSERQAASLREQHRLRVIRDRATQALAVHAGAIEAARAAFAFGEHFARRRDPVHARPHR
jgi:hypothetical protein